MEVEWLYLTMERIISCGGKILPSVIETIQFYFVPSNFLVNQRLSVSLWVTIPSEMQ